MSNNLGQIFTTVKNAEKHMVLTSQNLELSGNVIFTNGNLEISNNLIFNSFCVDDRISFKNTTNSTSYKIMKEDDTAIYFEAEFSGNNTSFVSNTINLINQWSLKEATTDISFTNNSNVFKPLRDAHYMIIAQANLDFGSTSSGTPKSELILYKYSTIETLTNLIVSANKSYDFRKVNNTITGSSPYTLSFTDPSGSPISDSANLVIDSGNIPVFDTINGYPGSINHYLDLTTFPNTRLPTNFAFELNLKLNSLGDSNNNDQPIFTLHKQRTQSGTVEQFMRLYRKGTSSTELTFEYINIFRYDSNDNLSYAWNGHKIHFNIDYTQFEHILITIVDGVGVTIYKNGSQVGFNSNGISDTYGTNTNTDYSGRNNSEIIYPSGLVIGRFLDRFGLGSDDDSGIEVIKYFRFYDTLVSSTQVYELYQAHVNNDLLETLANVKDTTYLSTTNSNQLINLHKVCNLTPDNNLVLAIKSSVGFDLDYNTKISVTPLNGGSRGLQGVEGPDGRPADLLSYSDASLNNIDISGTLNVKGDASLNNLDINGTIRLPDSSNNGYGVSGEILISQGNNVPPIWKPLEAPSYISWKLASDITLDNNNLDSDGNHRVKNISIYTLSQLQQVNNITYNTTTGDFTILTSGLYNYSFTAAVRPLSPSSGERYIGISIYVNNTLLANTTGVAVYVESSYWNRNNICLNNIAYLNAGDIIHFKVSPSKEDYNATLTLNETNGFLVKIA